MNTAAREWQARVEARNAIDTAKSQAASRLSWVDRCRMSRARNALALCAVKIISDAHFPNYVVEMGDGSYRFATQAMTRVFGAPCGEVIRRYLRMGSATELTGPEGRLMLTSLNTNLAIIHGSDIRSA